MWEVAVVGRGRANEHLGVGLRYDMDAEWMERICRIMVIQTAALEQAKPKHTGMIAKQIVKAF